jgi:predicted nucleic acid-binding protein
MLGQKNAIAAAENYWFLRKKGITIRKTLDCMIATFCINNEHSLLLVTRIFSRLRNIWGLWWLICNMLLLFNMLDYATQA